MNWPELLMTVVVAGFALYFFWQRSSAMALVAFLLVCLDVVMIERMVHSSYTLSDDGVLEVNKGRFSKRLRIPLEEIIRVEVRKTPFGLTRYVLIEHGHHRLVSIQPERPEEFVWEVRKRLNMIGK